MVKLQKYYCKSLIYLALILVAILLLCTRETAIDSFQNDTVPIVTSGEQERIIYPVEHKINCVIQKSDLAYTIQRILSSETFLSPYPHAVITDFFSPKVYGCIMKHLKAIRSPKNLKKISSRMSPKEIEQARRSYNELNTPSHLDRIEQIYNLKKEDKRFLQDFRAILNNYKVRNSWLQKFTDPLLMRSPKFEIAKSRTFSRQLLTIDSTSYAIWPHTDSVDKLVTILVYLPADNRFVQDLGTLLLRKKNSTQSLNISGKQRAHWNDFEVVKQAPFKSNVALAFSACEESWHAVKEVGKMKESRISLQTFIMKEDVKGKEKVGPCSSKQKESNFY